MIRLRCLGTLSLLRDGTALPAGAMQPRRLALLAVLAASRNRPQSRDRLAVLLWPDSDDERAKGSLAQAVYSLRRDLGSEDAIQGARDLALNPDVIECDLWEFDSHRESGAMELASDAWTGPFLDGFVLPGLGDFERWVETERATWSERHREVLERLATDAERRDDRPAAVKWWRKAAAQDPHSARITVKLMRALARSGDRAGAIRQSEIYTALLDRDLELGPDPTVVKEAEAIRNAESPAQVTADWPARPGVPVPATGPSATQPTPEAVPPATVAHHRPRHRRWWALGLLSGAAVTAATILLWPSPNPEPRPERVLVIPLHNDTGDSTLSLVGPMVAEWITRGLSETGLVDVIDSRTVLEAPPAAAPTSPPSASSPPTPASASAPLWWATSIRRVIPLSSRSGSPRRVRAS